MTTKDFIRKREFFLPFFEYLVRDFPEASLYDVIVYMEDGSSKHWYTFSEQFTYLSRYESIFITRVTKRVFDALKKRFMSFLISCSKYQRNSLVQYYCKYFNFDEYSFTYRCFSVLLNNLESKLPINES